MRISSARLATTGGGATHEGRPLRLLDGEDFDPIEAGHAHLGDDEYLTEDREHLDDLIDDGIAEVLDWDYDTDDTGGVVYTGPPEPIVRAEDEIASVVHPTENGTELQETSLTAFECQMCGTPADATIVNGEIQPPQQCDGCDRQGPFVSAIAKEDPLISPETFANPEWDTRLRLDPDLGVSDSFVWDYGYPELWPC